MYHAALWKPPCVPLPRSGTSPAGQPDISGAGRGDTLLQPLTWGVTHSPASVSGSNQIIGGASLPFSFLESQFVSNNTRNGRGPGAWGQMLASWPHCVYPEWSQFLLPWLPPRPILLGVPGVSLSYSSKEAVQWKKSGFRRLINPNLNLALSP